MRQTPAKRAYEAVGSAVLVRDESPAHRPGVARCGYPGSTEPLDAQERYDPSGIRYLLPTPCAQFPIMQPAPHADRRPEQREHVERELTGRD